MRHFNDLERITASVSTHLLRQSDALAMMLGGNAIFTLKSTRTGREITYRIRNSKRDNHANPDFKFVSVKIGNETVYMGFITRKRNGWQFTMDRGNDKIGRIAKVSDDQMEVVAFNYVWSNLWAGRTINDLEVWATTTCCRCGRQLRKANSIADAMGPVCHAKHEELKRTIDAAVAERKLQLA